MIKTFFPFSYTGELIIQKTKKHNYSSLKNRYDFFLKNDESPLNSERWKIIYPPFFKISLRIFIDLNEDYDTIKIKYRLSLFELNIILLIAILFSLLFFYASKNIAGISSIIVAFVYYMHSISHVSNTIKRIAFANQKVSDSLQNLKLWENQRKWINDDTLCSACGEPLNKYSDKCVNCGLNHANKKRKFENKNITVNSLDIKYNVTKKSKNRS